MRGSERPVVRNESGLAIVCPHCSAITLHTLTLLSNKGQSEHSTMLLLSHLISFHRPLLVETTSTFLALSSPTNVSQHTMLGFYTL